MFADNYIKKIKEELMADLRHQKLAKVLVHYSLEIKPGDRFVIHSNPVAAPLIREIYQEAIKVGAFVSVRTQIDGLGEIFFKEASDEQVNTVTDLFKFENTYFTALLELRAANNTRELSGIDPKRLSAQQAAYAPYSQEFQERSARGELRWCVSLFPTNAFAQDAGMALSDYEEFVYCAGLLDDPDPVASWNRVKDEQQRIADFLGQRDEIHIVGPDTDITYHVGGRTWINAAGKRNFPDGEVFTGPIEDSVNGTVRFTYPAVMNGNEVQDIRLTFREGKVVEATAAKGEDFLHAMLDMDAGSRRLGEVAFGLNYGVKQFSRNILFDEKIGGTMHMALGMSIPESGGKNESGLHWDIVCDLREAKVFADGKQIYEAGHFTI
jgi:aminopeptidase